MPGFNPADYEMVAPRLRRAHGEGAEPKGIQSITTEPLPMGQAWGVKATITFADGRVFTGLSEIKYDATSGADKDAPAECAETSAVGRALAMAGYFGSTKGLAGREEVEAAERRATQRGSWPRNGQGPQANGEARTQSAGRRQGPGYEPGENAPTAPVARPSGPPDVNTLRQRYDHWRGLALTVGLDAVPPAPEGADANQLVDLGIALRKRVDEARKAKGGQP
jgi:hypothetical protein